MSFINWGIESQGQKDARRRFEEEQALYEQAVRFSRAQATVLATSGSGGLKKSCTFQDGISITVPVDFEDGIFNQQVNLYFKEFDENNQPVFESISLFGVIDPLSVKYRLENIDNLWAFRTIYSDSEIDDITNFILGENLYGETSVIFEPDVVTVSSTCGVSNNQLCIKLEIENETYYLQPISMTVNAETTPSVYFITGIDSGFYPILAWSENENGWILNVDGEENIGGTRDNIPTSWSNEYGISINISIGKCEIN